jgi:bifunctional non-homologous end joining protein LigD
VVNGPGRPSDDQSNASAPLVYTGVAPAPSERAAAPAAAPWEPMEPVLWREAFDDPAWRFQPKWDGIRGLVVVRGGIARLFGRGGGERTDRYPEVVAALPQAVGGRDCWLDGEVVALVGGRPSFEHVMRRAMSRDPSAAKRVPVHYAVFDLVAADGRDLRRLPFVERDGLLAQVLRAAGPVLPTPTWAGAGRALFAEMRARGWEGIVGKRADGPYVAGTSGLWRKVKVRRRQLCAVLGYTSRGGRVRSLLVGAYDAAGRMVDLGSVASGLTEAHLAEVGAFLKRQPSVPAPFRGRRESGVEVRFVSPSLCVLVEYAERGSDGRLRAPVAVGFVPEARPADAVLNPA